MSVIQSQTNIALLEIFLGCRIVIRRTLFSKSMGRVLGYNIYQEKLIQKLIQNDVLRGGFARPRRDCSGSWEDKERIDSILFFEFIFKVVISIGEQFL